MSTFERSSYDDFPGQLRIACLGKSQRLARSEYTTVLITADLWFWPLRSYRPCYTYKQSSAHSSATKTLRTCAFHAKIDANKDVGPPSVRCHFWEVYTALARVSKIVRASISGECEGIRNLGPEPQTQSHSAELPIHQSVVVTRQQKDMHEAWTLPGRPSCMFQWSDRMWYSAASSSCHFGARRRLAELA